jgi:hypothetical protein
MTTPSAPGLPRPERLVPLAGAMNFRDVGGYPAADGRTVRWGCVYRSDGLDQLTNADARFWPSEAYATSAIFATTARSRSAYPAARPPRATTPAVPHRP